MYVNKIEYMCFKREEAIFTPSGRILKLVDKFTYLGSNISSTESDINIRIAKAWTAIDWLLIKWKYYPIWWNETCFFLTVTVSTLMYGCSIWTLTKRREKKLDRNYIRMLRDVLNKSRKEHPSKQLLYGYLPTPIAQTIWVKWTRYVGDCYSWICQCWLTSKNLFTSVLFGHCIQFRGSAGSNGW